MTSTNAKTRSIVLYAIACGFLLLPLLSACNYPTEGDCDPEDLTAPINIVPSNGDVIEGLSPVVAWEYAGACDPDVFNIELWDITGERAEVQSATVDGLAVSWSPSSPLTPASVYDFRIEAVSGSTSGQQAWALFRTGPVCEVGDPSGYPAPALVSPADGEVIDTLINITSVETGEVIATTPTFTMVWEDASGCVTAEGYEIQLSRVSTFPPGLTRTLHSVGHSSGMWFFAPGEEWHDCETYYWRVIPLLGDDVTGHPSETWSFTINTSGIFCMPGPIVGPVIPEPDVSVPLTGHGAISGHVWHDECATPEESTDTAPPGCIILPDGGIESNGELDDGEAGIEGVTVRLSTGPCPGEGDWTAATDVSGHYGFYDLLAGTYCLEIDPEADGNADILIPGNWTVPERWYGPGPITVEVTLGSDDDISRMNDFAWDYQFLPLPPAPTYSLTATINVNCRTGPGLNYEAIGFLLEGEQAEANARNASNTWWRVYLPSIPGNCWVSDAAVDAVFDPSGLSIVAVPEPTTAPPECSVDLEPAACEAAGGVYYTGANTSYCICP